MHTVELVRTPARTPDASVLINSTHVTTASRGGAWAFAEPLCDGLRYTRRMNIAVHILCLGALGRLMQPAAA
jgi:hypothetical protein